MKQNPPVSQNNGVRAARVVCLAVPQPKRLLDYFFAVLFTDMFEGIVRCVCELRAPTPPPAKAATAKRGAANNDPPPLSDQLAVACSLGGGLLSSVVTLPADVIVAQLMSTDFKVVETNNPPPFPSRRRIRFETPKRTHTPTTTTTTTTTTHTRNDGGSLRENERRARQ